MTTIQSIQQRNRKTIAAALVIAFLEWRCEASPEKLLGNLSFLNKDIVSVWKKGSLILPFHVLLFFAMVKAELIV